MEEVNKYFPMKASSKSPLKIYLGVNVVKVQLTNGVEAYAISMNQYLQEDVKNVEKYLHDHGLALLKKASMPLLTNYIPEVDGSPELDEWEAAFYQSLIGILRKMVEMGRLDICMEVSVVSSSIAIPREDHFQKLVHLFAYLNIRHNTRLLFDP